MKDQYFFDIDVDLTSNMDDEIQSFASGHGRIAVGVLGCLRYVFDDSCLADSFKSMLDTYNILYTAHCRVAGSALLCSYPGPGN